jgi:hypothetical protein
MFGPLFKALPPPVPPRFASQFVHIVNLLQCDVMIHILSLILQRSVAVRSRSWSETQLDRVRAKYKENMGKITSL